MRTNPSEQALYNALRSPNPQNAHHRTQIPSPMASSSLSLLHYSPPHRCSSTVRCLSPFSPPPTTHLRCRRLSLLLLSSPAAASILSFNSPSKAEDIPLFGLRKKLKKVEEEAEEIVKEGEEVVEKEIQVAEQGIQAAEQGIAGGLGIGVAGDLIQAGTVAGAEAVGVVVGLSVVNGILGPEGKKL